jgi:hypothetical protein
MQKNGNFSIEPVPLNLSAVSFQQNNSIFSSQINQHQSFFQPAKQGDNSSNVECLATYLPRDIFDILDALAALNSSFKATTLNFIICFLTSIICFNVL